MSAYFYLLLIPIVIFSQIKPLTDHLYYFIEKISTLYLDVVFTKEFLIGQRAVCPWSEHLEDCDDQGPYLMIIDENKKPVKKLWNSSQTQWTLRSFGPEDKFSFKPSEDGVYLNASLHGYSSYGAIHIYLSKSGRIRFEQSKNDVNYKSLLPHQD
jgi:hypothetical protein